MNVDLKLDWATHAAAKYACENWHYSKSIPKSKLVKIGSWENGVFVGVIIFSYGATEKLVNPYGLKMHEGCELTRIAFRDHIHPISRNLSIALKMLKKSNPGLKLVVSFADTNENHHGGIYQATNWTYSGKSADCFFFKDKKGKIWHPRNVSENLNLNGKMVRPSDCQKIFKQGKHRYLMALDKETKNKIQSLTKPYPKRAQNIDGDVSGFQSEKGGSSPTCALQLS